MVEFNPPLLHDFAKLVSGSDKIKATNVFHDDPIKSVVMEECELPLIDLCRLASDDEQERHSCMEDISKASSEWGFFQVVNHGIDLQLLREMRREQKNLFQAPFEKKATCGLLNNSYRWGNPTATTPTQFSWSEAFHIPLTKISEEAGYGQFTSLREVMEEYAAAMEELVRVLAGVLAMNLGHQKGTFEEICNKSTCFLRLNRYPPCPLPTRNISGLVAHTDSDFLTILHQDEQVGGLQLMKDSKWVAVKPNEDSLIVNIGDLFQAWSNDMYKSVEHKVIADPSMERYSIAYFLCPSYESTVGSCKEPSIYKKFTFGEYRKQIQLDVKMTGHKIGLTRFLL